MKKDSLILTLVILISLLSGNRGFAEVTQPPVSDKWVDFTLIDCNHSELEIIFSIPAEDPNTIISKKVFLELNITQLRDAKLSITIVNDSLVANNQRGINLHTIEVTETGYKLIETVAYKIYWIIESKNITGDKILKNLIIGQYRIHEDAFNSSGEWENFQLTDCNPKEINFFSSYDEIHNLTLNLAIESLINSSLKIQFSYLEGSLGLEPKEYYFDYEIKKTGNYSYTQKANRLFIEIQKNNSDNQGLNLEQWNATVSGKYKLSDLGIVGRRTPGLTAFITIITIVLLVRFKKLKNQRLKLNP